MSDELNKDGETEQTEAEPKKRKMLLAKRVVRHFSVRTGVHAGMKGYDDGSVVCQNTTSFRPHCA